MAHETNLQREPPDRVPPPRPVPPVTSAPRAEGPRPGTDPASPGDGGAAAVPLPHRTLLPPKGFWVMEFRELWEFREVAYQFARRDITLRYRQTALGVIWVVLQPLLQAGVFTFLFHSVAKLHAPDDIPYFCFSFSGMLVWNTFNTTLTTSSASVLGNSPMIAKVYFPRVILPLYVIGTSVLNFVVALGMMFVLIAVYPQVTFGWWLATVPVWLVFTLLLSEGVGMMTSAWLVRYRDVQYVLPFFTQLLMFITPVAYAVSAIPKHLRWVAYVNPLTGLIQASRWSLLGKPPAQWGLVGYSLVASVVIFFVGWLVFARFERQFADVI